MDNKRTGALSASWLMITLKGVLAGLTVTALMLLLFAGAMLWLALPFVWTSVFTYAATAAGAFAGGFVSGASARKKGLRSGAITGAAMFAVAFLIGLIAGRSVPGVGTLAISAGISVGFAALGGAVGVNKK